MRLAFIMLATTALMIGAAGQASGADPATDLPPGPGHDVTAQTCMSCHGADTITQRRLSSSDWKGIVDLMVTYGAKASDKQKAEIADYLSRNFPPVVAPGANAARVSSPQGSRMR